MEFDRDSFAAVLGSTFLLKAASGQSVNIELDEVSELKEGPHQVSFSILFRFPKEYTIEQGLYDVEHEVLGAAQIFLVPVLEGPHEMKLEAVFNFVRQERENQ